MPLFRAEDFLVDDDEFRILKFDLGQFVQHLMEARKLIGIFALANIFHRGINNQNFWQERPDASGQSMDSNREAALEKCFLSTAAQVGKGSSHHVPSVPAIYLRQKTGRINFHKIIRQKSVKA
jgi:hypothetical protein